ncbi:MAG: ABC transporter ATP-binding protein [Oscillospiraceae bacterium]|nr:ABC transporter ATP-binding protein [Oscillospiraceae bacterium]
MLEVRNLTKTFGSFTALKELNMTIPRGAVYGLVGPNGAGKTTLIRHITGVYRPDCGGVTLDGEAIWENPSAKGKIGFIPDDLFFFNSASIEDMRKYYKGLYPKFDDALFEKLGEAFELPRKSPIRKFSKGMKKQASFWLTVACRPELLVLDEPVDGLDPVMRRQIMGLILADVAQYGTTVLVSSHNLRELEDICDHVGIMDKGRMLLERSLEDMQGGTVKVQLVGEIPEGLTILHRSDTGRLKTIVVRTSAADAESILSKADLQFYEVLPLSLEEIFIYELGGADYAVKDIIL